MQPSPARIDSFGIPILRPGTTLDRSHAQRLRFELEQAIDSACRAVVVDLSQVVQMDPPGVEILLNAQRQLGRQRRRLILLDAAPQVQAALRGAFRPPNR